MHEKWAIGDTHLFHDNTWKLFKKEDGSPLRPFTSTAEMHETFVRNWNAVVGVNDYVYHVGDVTMRIGSEFNGIMGSLNGRKRLIIGNHDDRFLKEVGFTKWFEKILLWKGFKEYDLTLSHMPLKEGHFRDGRVNGHGHTHAHKVKGPYINLCVETRNWTPVNFDVIIKEVQEITKDLDNRDKINSKLNTRHLRKDPR